MIINEKSETGLSGFFIVFNGSTMNEKPGWYGLSHLIVENIINDITLEDVYKLEVE
jgi:hypothetical protein